MYKHANIYIYIYNISIYMYIYTQSLSPPPKQLGPALYPSLVRTGAHKYRIR